MRNGLDYDDDGKRLNTIKLHSEIRTNSETHHSSTIIPSKSLNVRLKLRISNILAVWDMSCMYTIVFQTSQFIMMSKAWEVDGESAF